MAMQTYSALDTLIEPPGFLSLDEHRRAVDAALRRCATVEAQCSQLSEEGVWLRREVSERDAKLLTCQSALEQAHAEKLALLGEVQRLSALQQQTELSLHQQLASAARAHQEELQAQTLQHEDAQTLTIAQLAKAKELETQLRAERALQEVQLAQTERLRDEAHNLREALTRDFTSLQAVHAQALARNECLEAELQGFRRGIAWAQAALRELETQQQLRQTRTDKNAELGFLARQAAELSAMQLHHLTERQRLEKCFEIRLTDELKRCAEARDMEIAALLSEYEDELKALRAGQEAHVRRLKDNADELSLRSQALEEEVEELRSELALQRSIAGDSARLAQENQGKVEALKRAVETAAQTLELERKTQQEKRAQLETALREWLRSTGELSWVTVSLASELQCLRAGRNTLSRLDVDEILSRVRGFVDGPLGAELESLQGRLALALDGRVLR